MEVEVDSKLLRAGFGFDVEFLELDPFFVSEPGASDGALDSSVDVDDLGWEVELLLLLLLSSFGSAEDFMIRDDSLQEFDFM